ncbi:hypothetical protein K470DRAFT_69842 [Piedraia hortae CBS 480.64]|uniref:RNase H type-1 domain-containing protein n=1 Tax=Piedraia hortae CBS 480.64 TaxID=1314780 RepID=A0A6A7BZF4_9PEZI|nr:hypothetical protein K470DRAFT_69842 [Piedraia hortae CBS 480.64]
MVVMRKEGIARNEVADSLAKVGAARNPSRGRGPRQPSFSHIRCIARASHVGPLRPWWAGNAPKSYQYLAIGISSCCVQDRSRRLRRLSQPLRSPRRAPALLLRRLEDADTLFLLRGGP